MSGIVYLLTNPAMPGLVKIGQTVVGIEERMKQLDSTSLPYPFECFYAVVVADPVKVERALHDAFDDHRVNRRREFFQISPDRAKAVLELVQERVVTPGRDVVEEPEDQQALDEARERRSNFNFSMIGLKPGETLTSVFDEAITATVANEKNRILFRNEIVSLSAAALTIAHEMGYGWATIAGPAYWKYNGMTLAERRDAADVDE